MIRVVVQERCGTQGQRYSPPIDGLGFAILPPLIENQSAENSERVSIVRICLQFRARILLGFSEMLRPSAPTASPMGPTQMAEEEPRKTKHHCIGSTSILARGSGAHKVVSRRCGGCMLPA